MNKALRTILRVSLLALVAVIIGVNIYTLNASRLAGNAVPMPFGFGVSVVLSGSMESELSIGDLIFISERDGYEVGDVVVYQDGGIAVVHRIISIDGETVTTKGDANNTPDAAISMESIKGEVTMIMIKEPTISSVRLRKRLNTLSSGVLLISTTGRFPIMEICLGDLK